MTSRHTAQQRLLDELQANGSTEAADAAAGLQADYHAREMALLSHDVYAAARQDGQPPPGWTRATADLDALREAMPDLDLTDESLRELLTPRESGFRAEIYLPDPAVLGPGYKPTLVFKGSMGEVMENGNLRDTTLEDFLGNNLPQALGVPTDYYDRAMRLAVALRREGIEFDLAGHSLAGGMASAAAAVTGMRAVTYNAAGLHPSTAKEYADARNLPLFETRTLVTAWQVRGDVLNDGVQHDLRGMSDVHRTRLAMLLTDTIDVMRHTPAGRDHLEPRLLAAIPEDARPALQQALGLLQKPDAAELIRDLPVAAGERKPPLVAMTRQEQALVEREDRASLAELQQLGGPLLTVLALGARGANVGAVAGQVVADGGRVLGGGIDATGDAIRLGVTTAGLHIDRTYRGTGVALHHGALGVGEVTAQARMAGAQVGAAIDHARGWAQYTVGQARGGVLRSLGQAVGTVSETWQQDLQSRAAHSESAGLAARDRSRETAAATLDSGRRDAQGARDFAHAVGGQVRSSTGAIGAQARDHLVYVGDRLDAGYEVMGSHVTRVTSHAPTVGAGIGGVTGAVAGGASVFDVRTRRGIDHWSGTIELVREAAPGVAEAVDRHGMASAVLPSMDRHVEALESDARALLQRARLDIRESSTPGDRPALLSGDTGTALERLLAAVASGDDAAAARASAAMLHTGGATTWLAGGHAQLEARDRLVVPDADPRIVQNAPSPEAEAIEPAR